MELVDPSAEDDVVSLAADVVADCSLSEVVCSDVDCVVVSPPVGLGVVPVPLTVDCPVSLDVDVPVCDDGVVDS